MNEYEISKRLEQIENRLSKLENCNDKSNLRNGGFGKENPTNIIEPSKMEEGRMGYVGHYVSEDGCKTIFGADCNRIESILNTNSFEMANIIEAFANEDRINLVKELLKRRRSAKELMEKLNFQTTGKLYHHLSFLEKLGVIQKDNNIYFVAGKYVSCILLIFSGVSKIIKNNYVNKD